MNVGKAHRRWRNSGQSIGWLLIWPRQRILHLLRDLFVEYDRLRKVHDKLRREQERFSEERAEEKQRIAELHAEIREKDERIVDLEHQLLPLLCVKTKQIDVGFRAGGSGGDDAGSN